MANSFHVESCITKTLSSVTHLKQFCDPPVETHLSHKNKFYKNAIKKEFNCKQQGAKYSEKCVCIGNHIITNNTQGTLHELNTYLTKLHEYDSWKKHKAHNIKAHG